ncbi:polyisoprenoid-binding protein YceI [Streptomyces sp. 840.1]|uniref:YceI family protein n=1 Tax=Streptomyces sp. 840.1 TaxID=2485152 RepID=UPI000F4616A7|nr:YceI family protein [Streptomyces sp. 840.1]ROQ60154.1 polyisoprenoid-binding protein YceI [Streptomyces sp. 840.1]
MSTKHDQAVPAGSASYAGVTGVYTVDPLHSTIGFSARHTMISNVRGRFVRFEGLLILDGSAPSRSEAYVSVQTDSMDTGAQELDAYLRGPDFFDAATFPLMSFGSTRVIPLGDDNFRLLGALRIKDIELPLDLAVVLGGVGADANGRHRVGFEGTATLRRSDWGLAWNMPLRTGGALISDKVTLSLDISAVRADLTPAA